MKDGIDCINVYSKGETELGRFLSNLAHVPIMTDDGPFESIEGYWYWLGTRNERLRKLYGYKAKELGKSLGRMVDMDEETFRNKIKKAIWYKIKANHRMLEEFRKSTLPLQHYYVFGGRQVKAGTQWLIEWVERLRQWLKDNELKRG